MTPTLRSKVASALSFAHLAGLGQRSKAEGDDPEKKDDEEAKGSRAEGDDSEDKEKDDTNSKKSKAEKGDDDKDYAEGDDPDKKDEDADAKGSKAEGDDKEKDAEGDDDEDEMSGKSAAASARRRERARCAAIFGSKAAGRNPVLAANLAFNTRMTRKEAIAVLESTPAAVQPGADRSGRNPVLGSGASAGRNPKQAIASSWDQAFASVPGHTRRS
jgi:hypothetical protein